VPDSACRRAPQQPWSTVQNAWYGLSLGSVLLLAAIGLAITFGVMGVINMAHGEMVMIGAYTTFVVQEVIRTRYPGLFDYSLLIAVPLAFLVAGAIGIADRAQHHPLPLRPAARDAARDLGPVADPAAGGAHDVRPDQPRGRQSRPG
jgi:branched-subunit amino acid ABC-type transport system permease component